MKKQLPLSLFRICKMPVFLSVFVLMFFISQTANAQIPVTVSGTAVTTPALMASYSSLAAALTDLNLISAFPTPGTIIFTCTAGSSETAPPTGLVIGSASLNPLLSATNTVTIVKASGTVTINAGVGTATPASAAPDGMISIRGADYITIDGLTFTDGNVANPATMEFGVGLFKAGVGDGCNNNTIQNCTFNMQRINNAAGTSPMIDGAVGILVINSTATAAITALTPTNGGTLATNGTNSGNKFYTNAINSGNNGIGLSGYAASSGVGPSPTATTFLGDLANDVGGAAASTGNTILNYGGGAATNPAAGIRANNQWSLNISYNTVNNNNGSGVNHATTLRGIYGLAGTSANATINNNTVTIQSGGTTTACTAIDNVIGSTAASNTVTINNNVVNLNYTTATTGICTGITNTSTAATVNINSNTITKVAGGDLAGTGTNVMIETGSPTTATANSNNINNITRSGASGSWRGIKTTSPTNFTANSNTIELLSWTNLASTGSMDAIYSLSSAVNVTANNNIIRNLSTPTTGTITGITENGITGLKTYQNNQIYNFSTTAGGVGGASFRGISESTGSTNDFSNNQIYSLNSTGTTGGTGGTIVGITVSSGTTNNIYKNKIYDLSSTSTGPTVSGITVSGSTTSNVYNNLIGDLRATAANAANPLIGLNITGSTTTNAYYNTVYLNGASTGALFGSSAVSVSTTPTVTLRNNIFYNNSTTMGAGLAVAYRRSGITLTTYGSASNNNDFFASTIYTDGTNTDVTIAAYKSRVTPRDASSFKEDPEFQSVVGSSADFLKYKVSSPKQVESGAVNITGFTDDYISTIRFGNAGYVPCVPVGNAPDMGAWELCGIFADLTGPSISYSLFSNTACLLDRTLTATITDASGVNATAGTKPRIYFKKSGDANTFAGNTSADNGWKFVEATNAASPFDLPTMYSLLQTVVTTGDSISYFVVAQDLATTPNVSINSGTFAIQPGSVALAAANFPITGTIKGYKIVPAGLSGTKTIGAVADYTSLTGATGLFNAINTSGLSTNLIVNIIDASVSETGAVALNAYASTGCSGGPFTVMIKPNTTATLTGSVASGALIKINGASNVTIDGSNGGGTDRSLTITNTNTTAPTAVSLVSLGTGLGASSNTIKNCNISTGVSAATGYGIAVGGSTPGTSGADNDNVTVQNNNVTVATVSIYAAGTASVTSGGDDNLQITGNTVNSNSALQNQGIQVGNALNSSITGNTVSVTSSGAVQPVGISLETGFVSSTITKNFITNVLATNTGGYGGRGITVGTGTASSSLTIANNVIYGVNGSNWSAFSNSSSIGIGIGVLGGGSLTTTTGGVNVYYNSVSMTGSMGSASSSALTTALYIGSAASVLDIRDNIFSNTQVGTSTTQKNYGIYSAAANTAFTTINFNEYYASNSFNTGSAFLGFIGSDRVDLPAIVSGFGQNANSIAGDPLFNGTSNLQPNLGSPALGAANNATTGITTDVLGIVRSSGIPPTGSTIGAYENAGDFQGPTITYTPSTIFPNTPFFCNPTVSVTITDASMVNTTAGTKPRLWYKYTTVAGGTHMNANALPATNDNTTDGWKYVEYSSNVGSVYTFILDYNLLNGGLPVTGDKISYFFVAQDLAATPNVGTNAGTYTLNPTSVALSAGVFPISGTNEYIFVSLTTAQPSTATVSAGTNNVQVIRVDVPPTSCGNVTQITFNTNGTTNAADLSKARVYYTSTTTFATTTQFGSDITNPSGSLVFTGAQATSSSTSNYFWLVYDISCAAPSAGGNVADAEFTQITLGGVSTLPIGAANINPTGTRTITSLTAALATNQPSTASVVQGAISQQVLRLDVPPTSCGNITQIDFGNASTSLTDVTKARVYYTTSTTFATTTQFGSDIVSPGLTFSVTGSQTPSGSLTNYFWLVFDISCTATPANVVDASVSSVTIGATGYTPTTTNPTGTRAITALLTGDNVQNAALALLGSGGGNPYDIAGRTLQTNEPTPIINTQPVSTNGAGSSNYSWGTAAGSTYWYRLVVPTTGYGSSGNLLIRATTPTTTPSADAQVALWKFPSMVPGTCSDPADFTGGVLLAANDDAIVTGTGYWGASASTLNSVIRVRLTPGQTYYIQLDGWSSNVPAGDLIIEDLADVAGKNVPNNGFGAIHNPTGVDMRYASYEVVGDDGWTYYYHNNGTTTDIADDVVVLGLNWSTSTTYLWNGTNATGNDLMNHVRRDAKSTTAPSTTGPASGTGSDAFIVWSGRNNASATSSDLKPTAPYVTASTLHWWMMNKFWNVFPNVQPTTSVAVRFFYSDADFTSLQTTVTTGGGTLATAADMNFIKATKSVSTHYTNAEMDPGSGHAALTSGTVTDLTASHTAGVQSGINQAQFNITTFSGGGAGSTGTPYSPLVIGCSNNVTSTANTGTGTLRDIIACVASGATITFDPSIWNSTIVLTSGSILINKNITLSGPTGADVINISANGTPPVFNITSGNLQFIGNVYIKQ